MPVPAARAIRLSAATPASRPTLRAQPLPKQPAADEANLDYARKQTDLALEHLREQTARDNSELLDELGWSRQDAARFLERWEQMKRAAGQQGAEGQAAKKSLQEAIKSLGLRPHGTQLQGQRAGDQLRSLRDAGRFDPPAEWAEQVREYSRGVAGEGR